MNAFPCIGNRHRHRLIGLRDGNVDTAALSCVLNSVLQQIVHNLLYARAVNAYKAAGKLCPISTGSKGKFNPLRLCLRAKRFHRPGNYLLQQPRLEVELEVGGFGFRQQAQVFHQL